MSAFDIPKESVMAKVQQAKVTTDTSFKKSIVINADRASETRMVDAILIGAQKDRIATLVTKGRRACSG